MKPNRPLALLAASAVAALGLAVEPLRMDVQNTFNGLGADSSSMTVTLENDGPDVRGVLQVEGDGTGTSYPVDLPQGARKRLLTLNRNTYGNTLRFVLTTGRKRLVREVTGTRSIDPNGGSAVLVGDDNGGLAFLREKRAEGKRQVQAQDAYVSPEGAPGRATAYRPYNAVFLGAGAERIDDATVQALKDYALGGGTLVFLGGASAPTLEDARWASVLPGGGWRPRTVARSPALADLGGEALPGPFTVLEPTSLLPGAVMVRDKSGASTFDTERGLGLGRVVVLGYSPLDAPLNVWGGRLKATARFVRSGESLRSRQFVEGYLNRGLENPSWGYSSPAGIPYPSGPQSDPFSTTLPPTGTVFGILAGYFILVVPASFLVLRKLKRGELAWVTAPLLSLGFAGLLFKSAEGLYAASLSTASQGVLVVQQGQPNATFYGTSQMFFPRGGTYDLRLQGVESLASVQEEYRYGSDRLSGFNSVDVGQILVPGLEASNLAFREMSFVQKVGRADWFRMGRVDARHVRVENRSPYGFSGSLAAGSAQSAGFELAPGESKVVATGTPAPTADVLPPTDARNFTRRSGRIALTGRIVGFRPGPQIGNEVRTGNGTAVVAFAQENVR